MLLDIYCPTLLSHPNWSKAFFALLVWFPSPYEKSGQGKLRWSLVPCDWLSFLWVLSPLWTVFPSFPFTNSQHNEWVTLNNQQKLEMQKKKHITLKTLQKHNFTNLSLARCTKSNVSLAFVKVSLSSIHVNHSEKCVKTLIGILTTVLKINCKIYFDLL